MNRCARRGFALYLAFVVTTVLFFFALGSLDMAKTAVDLGRSGTLDVVSFHAADGGLEIGLSRLRKQFVPFALTYSSKLEPNREVVVRVAGEKQTGGMKLSAVAEVFDGRKCVARRHLVRNGVAEDQGRRHCGAFAEES